MEITSRTLRVGVGSALRARTKELLTNVINDKSGLFMSKGPGTGQLRNHSYYANQLMKNDLIASVLRLTTVDLILVSSQGWLSKEPRIHTFCLYSRKKGVLDR